MKKLLVDSILPAILISVLFLGGCDLAQPLHQEPESSSVVQEILSPTSVPEAELPILSDTAAQPATPPQYSTSRQPSIDDRVAQIFGELFANKRDDVQVRGEAVVSRILEDDNEGDRHQRFILKLTSGQTLLVAHNIDIAPRLNGLAVGDRVGFFGEYYYNEKGGGIHWTHRAMGRRHVDGWLKWNGKVFW